MTSHDHAVTLWRAAGQGELDLVAASGWRTWPPGLPDAPALTAVLDRGRAVQICRERIVPAGGVGYVLRFKVVRSLLSQYSRDDGGAYRIEPGSHIAGAIVEEADFRGPVSDAEFVAAEEALGTPLPQAWRRYLQGPSWFRRGWLASGAYVWMNTPREMLDLHEAWDGSTAAHPGIAIIGGDGSRDQLVLDLRGDPAPVLLLDITSDGWDSAVRQADDVGQLVEEIENGGFEFAGG